MMLRLGKGILRALFGDYEVYEIYALDLSDAAVPDLSPWTRQGFEFAPLTEDALKESPHGDIRERAFYGGDEAEGFGVWKDGELIGLQWYWFGARYRTRNFWPLEPDQAKSVELYTLEPYRGIGIATALKSYSACEMHKKGFRSLFSRIWHSNIPSRRVSEKLGWVNIARVVIVYPFGLKALKVRITRRKPNGSKRP